MRMRRSVCSALAPAEPGNWGPVLEPYLRQRARRGVRCSASSANTPASSLRWRDRGARWPPSSTPRIAPTMASAGPPAAIPSRPPTIARATPRSFTGRRLPFEELSNLRVDVALAPAHQLVEALVKFAGAIQEVVGEHDLAAFVFLDLPAERGPEDNLLLEVGRAELG